MYGTAFRAPVHCRKFDRNTCLLQNITFWQYSLHLWMRWRTHERKSDHAYSKNLEGNALRESYLDLWHIHSLIPPLHRGCDLSASIVRPQNWPGRRWRQKGGRTVALVAQWWYIGCSDIAMDAMVAVKFWACSKQSHKGRRGGRSLTGRSKEAGGRHTHRHGGRMDAQWSAIGRPVKITYCCEHCVSIRATRLPSLYHHCASFGRPIAPIERSQWRPLCLHSATTATLQPPWQWFCLHSASFVRPVAPLQQIWSFKEGTRVVL